MAVRVWRMPVSLPIALWRRLQEWERRTGRSAHDLIAELLQQHLDEQDDLAQPGEAAS